MARYIKLFNAFLFGSLLFFGSVPYTANAAEPATSAQQASCDPHHPAAAAADSMHFTTNTTSEPGRVAPVSSEHAAHLIRRVQ